MTDLKSLNTEETLKVQFVRGRKDKRKRIVIPLHKELQHGIDNGYERVQMLVNNRWVFQTINASRIESGLLGEIR